MATTIGNPLSWGVRMLGAAGHDIGAAARELGSEGGVRLLDPLLEMAHERRCPADDILSIWHAVGGNPRAFVDKTRLRVD